MRNRDPFWLTMAAASLAPIPFTSGYAVALVPVFAWCAWEYWRMSDYT